MHGGVRPVERGEGDRTASAFCSASAALAAAPDVQVVLSRATRDLVVDRLADEVERVDLGVHRLRDPREHVYRLRHPELTMDVTRLRSLEPVPNNLPTEMTSFVGRRDELVSIGDLLVGSRLLTLVGAGGCGKTRLALAAATRGIEAYSDGAWWIELAELAEPSLVERAAVATIGLRDSPGRSTIETLIEHFGETRALLVLDNCEHVLAPSAELATRLGQACPALTILTTSRAPLGVAGEVVWRVPSLSLPTVAAGDRIDELEHSDAVRLFVDRARSVCAGFAITAANASAVAQICRDLDGIPLAIELAATRARMLTAEQIARGLGDRFHLLTRGSRTAMPRQQTLRASIDWSHALLGDEEQVLLRRLSVFAGGWTLDAAEAVCSQDGIERYAVLDLLAGLVDGSLVTTHERDAEMRYGLLETVRQYAAGRLSDAGEADAVRDRHRTHFVALAEATQPDLVGAGGQDLVVRRLAVELPNLRAALDCASATAADDGLRIAAAVELFWLFTGRYREGDASYARALHAAGEEPAELRGFVLAARANLGIYAGDSQNAPGWAKAALAIGERCGDLGVQARALNALGLMVARTDPRRGRELLTRAVELAAQVGDDWCGIDALQCVAVAWLWQDGFDAARATLDEAYARARPLGYRWGLAWHGLFRGIEAFYRGRLDEACELFGDAVRAAEDVGDPLTRSFASASIALIELERGDLQAALTRANATLERTLTSGAMFAFGWVAERVARIEIALGYLVPARAHLEAAVAQDRTAYMSSEHLLALGALERLSGNLEAGGARGREALETAHSVGSDVLIARAEQLLGLVALDSGDLAGAERLVHDALGRLAAGRLTLFIPGCLDTLAAVAAARDSFEEAARLLGAATGARARVGVVRFPAESDFWSRVEREAHDRLGGRAFETAFTAGAELTIDDAIAFARRARGERKRPLRGWESLTPTEREVIRHVADGLTNPQIGERMFIARGTVKVHLSHIFAKLGITTRSQLAAEATRRAAGPD